MLRGHRRLKDAVHSAYGRSQSLSSSLVHRWWNLSSTSSFCLMITRQWRFKTFPNRRRCSPPTSVFLQGFCFSSRYAQKLFDQSSQRNVTVSITPSMLESLRKNLPAQALGIFKENLQLGLAGNMDEVAISLALKACDGEPKLGCQIHGFAVTSGFISFVTVSNAIMGMYRNAGQFGKALCIFENLLAPDVVSWNTILSGFEDKKVALDFVVRMKSTGVVFDAFTYTTALAFCVDYEGFRLGSQLHSLIVKFGTDSDVFVGNALITMYSRWGSLREARRVFNHMPNKDLVSWNSMLSGYAQEGSFGSEAICAFREMVRGGMELDHVSFTSVMSACGHETDLELGRQIHGICIKRGYGAHVSVGNILMSTYLKCGVVEAAKSVFDRMSERNVVSWTTMMSTNKEDAMSFFHKMRLDGVYPNDVTFVGLIHAITCNKLIEDGLKVHGFCIKTGFISELNVCNSFITMYSKFEAMQDSKKVFDELNHREIISWNALISGFAQNGFSQAALQIFSSAKTEATPNEYTFGSALNAIAEAEDISLKHGQRCHAHIMKMGLNCCPIVFSALLDMYAKRGSICESEKVFNEMPERNQFAWTSIISAHARHGDFESLMNLFEEMAKENVKPDLVTFLSVLTACSRKGMVDTGYQIFNSMIRDYNLEPSHEHYSCMVDMLGRGGRLKEAEELMSQIPGGPGLSMLQSVLGACRIHGDVEMGERVAELLMEMEPEGSGSYVLMSNLYAEKGQWEKVAKIRKGMRQQGVKKEVGFSWADVGDVEGSLSLHGFSSGDMSHPKSSEILRMTDFLGAEMKFERNRDRKEKIGKSEPL